MNTNAITLSEEQQDFIKKGEIQNMFGIKLNNDIQVNIGDKYDVACDKINEFLSLNEDKLWGESEELNDKMLSTKITIYSKGPVVPYEEVTFIIIDEIVTDINIFGSNLYIKYAINDEELTAEEACTKYSEHYNPQSFCNKLDRIITEEDAIKECDRARCYGCNCGCKYNKQEKRYIELDDGNIVISIEESGFKNAVIGKDKHGHPIYSDVERRYCGLHLACYLEYEEYTPTQAS